MRPTKSLLASVILLTAMGVASLPSLHATEVDVRANPNSGTIFNFPAVPLYQDFSSSLTVTGLVSGTPTWTAAPADGSPTCANFIQVTFGNANAWNTTATFDDHSIFGCQATMNLSVHSLGTHGMTSVNVTYVFCARCV